MIKNYNNEQQLIDVEMITLVQLLQIKEQESMLAHFLGIWKKRVQRPGRGIYHTESHQLNLLPPPLTHSSLSGHHLKEFD